MNTAPFKRLLTLFFALAGLMAITRFRLNGSALDLPDASLAVFFLAGFWLRPAWPFAVLFVEAALIDYSAVTFGGVSGECLSAAYWVLIPAYACLWYGGRWSAVPRRKSMQAIVISTSIALFLSATLAFLISNAGFYLFSGRFPHMGALQYAAAVVGDYPLYVVCAFGYLVAAALVYTAWSAIAKSNPVTQSYRHE